MKNCIRMTVPLFIRLLEYAREDAKSDLPLHDVAERAMKESEILDMDDYEGLVGKAGKAGKADLDDKPLTKPRAKVDRIAKDYVS
jgi:hypothetical protein